MADIRDQFTGMIAALGKLSELAQIRDLKREADNTDRRTCGNCQHWMKSRSCPSERNENGRQRGPSCESMACGKFLIEPWVEKLKRDRLLVVERRIAALAPAKCGGDRS